MDLRSIIQEPFYMGGAKTVKNKILSFLLLLNLAFILTACEAESSNKMKIVTTIFPQYDFAKHIAGDNAEITLLLTPGSESHTYEPTAADIAKIQQADLFIYNGGESEIWVEKILNSYGKDGNNTLRLMDYVTPLTEDDEDEYDEHIFTSLKNSEILVDVINNKICDIDEKNSQLYTKNTEDYKTKITQLDKKYEAMIAAAKRKTVIFGDRFPFRYFAHDYGLDCHAAFSGCGSETEASPTTISDLISKVKNDEIPIVFFIEFSNKDVANKIAAATNTKTELLHSCHNISKDDLKNNVTYIDLMTNNYNVLSEALN